MKAASSQHLSPSSFHGTHSNHLHMGDNLPSYHYAECTVWLIDKFDQNCKMKDKGGKSSLVFQVNVWHYKKYSMCYKISENNAPHLILWIMIKKQYFKSNNDDLLSTVTHPMT
jgi:hypothetical protein